MRSPLLRVLRVLRLTRRPLVGLIVHDYDKLNGYPTLNLSGLSGSGLPAPDAGAEAPAPTVHKYESATDASDSTSKALRALG